VVLGLAQTLGQFVARHLFRIVFTILALFVLYRGGEALAQDINRLLRNSLGDRAEHYLDLATRSLRAMVNGTLVVGLFDGILIGIISALAGVQHPEVWGAMTGVLAVIPFAGYVVVAGVAVALMAETSAFAGLAVLAVGTVILFLGDKVVRPLLVGRATQLGFVWVLMGSLGGLAITGLLGVFLGPVVLSLAGAVWNELTHKTPSRANNPVSRPS
jgi:predicted PurR-regulated permease PerM